MGYEFILIVAMILLVWKHRQRPETSERSRKWIEGLAAASIAIELLISQLSYVALVMQLCVCVWLISLKLIVDANAEIAKEESSAVRELNRERLQYQTQNGMRKPNRPDEV